MKENPEWRKCRTGCCKTHMQVCYYRGKCRCHTEPAPQSAPSYDDDWSAW